MKTRLIFTAVSLLFSSYLFSQEPPVAVLTDGDLDKFIETVVPMSEELNQLGLANKGSQNDPGQMWLANAEAKAILDKYEWDETFAAKFSAITLAYTYTKVKQEIDKMPEDQKAQAEQMMPIMQGLASMVHEDDLKIVEAKTGELEAVFKNLDKL
jgi:hypothetical protein